MVLEKAMEKAHIQLTIVVLEEIERAADEIPNAKHDVEALCLKLATCRRLSDMAVLVDTIWQLACTILGEKRAKAIDITCCRPC